MVGPYIAGDVSRRAILPAAELGGDVDEHGRGQGVQVRTLLVGGMPLLVASSRSEDEQLRERVVAAGVEPLDAFVGRELPRGARVGFVVDDTELRLVDERDTTLLRAAREGLDSGWFDRARQLKGTMLVLVRARDLAPLHDERSMARLLDDAASDGDAWGAVVGFGEQRPSLPLMIG